MRLVAHASPLVLEGELLDRVAAAKSADALAPVLIVVPSRRLADHVNRRLVERFGAVLNVSVLHHRALAERVLEQAGATARPVLSDDLTATLFARVVQRAPAGPLRDFVRDRPGAATAMQNALTDLREAGLEPAVVRATLAGPEAETAALYGLWSEALDELQARTGAVDETGLAREAAREATSFASRFSAILHHGAYDLLGVRIDLVRALDRGRELTFLLPADPVAPAGAFGTRRAHAIAEAHTEISALPGRVPAAEVLFLHAQGAGAELQTAAYEALAAVAGGTPPHEVAIVVRSWGPYAAAMDALLDAGGIGWHTSYTRPLRRDPLVGRALREIIAGADRGPRAWTAHADEFAMLSQEADAEARFNAILQSMRDVESVLGDDRAVSLGEALAWLTARVDATAVPPSQAAGSGVRILDAMQARGLTFRHLGLAGMNAGVFPIVAREHPFLSDASRAHLRELTGRPLPIASERDGEEHLLLAMLLGATRDRINVSWRRADESARPVVASLALRDVARFSNLDGDAADVERDARALPAHPRARLAAWAASPGLLSRRDETLLAALASESGADAGPAVVSRKPEWTDGVRLVAASESFEPTPGPYDGRIGRSVVSESIAATALARLGRCPLQFFFRDVLRIDAAFHPATPFATDPAAIGSRVHDALRDVYSRLREEGAFEGGDVGTRVERARTLVREAWDDRADTEATARAARFPVLDRIERGIWLKTLDAFLAADLARMADGGLVPESLEHEVAGAIPGGPERLAVRARFDRVLQSGNGRIVGDYKTGGRLADRVKPGDMLSGAELQVPIYALLSGSPVELLGVGPRHDGEVARFDGFKSGQDREGLVETLRVLVALAASGRFPIRPGEHCGWCDFRSACRHGHPPTLFREGRAADVVDARDCWEKTAKNPTLAAVRAATP